MNARLDYSPIVPGCPEPRKPSLTAHTTTLEAAVVQPDYLAMDDVADWAQTYCPTRPADPDDVFSQDEDADEALANAVNDADTLQALDWLHANKVLPDHVWHVITEASMAMAEKRLNRSA